MAKSRSRKKKAVTNTPAKPKELRLAINTALAASPQTPLRQRRWVRYLQRLFGAVVVLVGLIAGAYQLMGGPPWPTDPEIRPHDTADASSTLVLPFTIRNRSTLFDMNNVNMTCGVDLVMFSDASGATAAVENAAFSTGNLSIPANSTANYPCDASGLVQVRPDGSFILRDNLSTKGAVFKGPLTIRKMCMWIGGDYKIGPMNESFTSTIFKWPASQTSRQWIEGPTATNQDRPTTSAANDFDKIECRFVKGPIIYFKGTGLPLFVPDLFDRPR